MKNKVRRSISYLIVYLFVMQIFMSYATVTAYAVSKWDHSDRIIVSLGDSYSSGEGIPEFYDQDLPISEKVKSHDWLAHRSKKAWGGQLTLDTGIACIRMSDCKYIDKPGANNTGVHWYFAASSGAESKHIKKKQKKDYYKSGNPGTEYLDPQLDIFGKIENAGKADYVTLTLGGNDLGFSSIVFSVVWGSTYMGWGDLDKKLKKARKKVEVDGEVTQNLRQAYIDIMDRAGSQATLIVAGYPHLYRDDGKGASVSKDEARDINNSIDIFNDRVRTIVGELQGAGRRIEFVDVVEKFRNHEAYSENKPFLNPIIIGTESEDLVENDIKSAYSMHPNEDGAKAYAEAVQEKIDSLDAQPVAGVSDDSDSSLNRVIYQDYIQDIKDQALEVGDNYIKVDDETYYCKYSIADFDGDGLEELMIYSENWWNGGFREVSTGGNTLNFYKYSETTKRVEVIGGYSGLDGWDDLNGECPFVFHTNGFVSIGDYVFGVKHGWMDSIDMFPLTESNGNIYNDSASFGEWGSLGIRYGDGSEDSVEVMISDGMGGRIFTPGNSSAFVNSMNAIFNCERLDPVIEDFGN